MRVLKWDVPVDDKNHGIGSGQVLHVACQYDPRTVQVWTLEESGTVTITHPRMACVFGTGHEVPDGWEPLGSVLVHGGQIVWHVMAEPRRES